MTFGVMTKVMTNLNKPSNSIVIQLVSENVKIPTLEKI